MTRVISVLVLMLVVAGFALSQSQGSNNFQAQNAFLFKTYSPFTATSDDTTGIVSVSPPLSADVLLAREVRLLGVCTDSLAADVYVIGYNRTQTAVTTTYTDSLVTTSNTGTFKVIDLRAPGVNRLAGCTEFKVGTVFRATGQGTTTGRTMKWYLLWVK